MSCEPWLPELAFEFVTLTPCFNLFQFFRTMPLACDPSSLPKLPPSKEYDVRLRQEEARRYMTRTLFSPLPYVHLGFIVMLTFSSYFYSSRQRNAALGGRGAESIKPGIENHVTSRAIDIAAEVKVSMIHGLSKLLQYSI